MVRIGRPPRIATGRRIWRYANVAGRYTTNLMLALVIIAIYAA